MDLKQIDVEMLMQEADKRGNQQIDFDEVNFFIDKYLINKTLKCLL